MAMVSSTAAYISLSSILYSLSAGNYQENLRKPDFRGCNSRPCFKLETSCCLITGSAPFADGSTFMQGKSQQRSWEQSCDLSGKTLASQNYRI